MIFTKKDEKPNRNATAWIARERGDEARLCTPSFICRQCLWHAQHECADGSTKGETWEAGAGIENSFMISFKKTGVQPKTSACF